MRSFDFERDLWDAARDRGLALSKTVEFIFRRRYNLPPTDPRFLDATLEDMLVDHWAHRHTDDPKLRDEIVAEGYEEDLAAMEAEMLAQQAASKPADDWEVLVDDRYDDPTS
jgi:hypothetical protein